MLLAQTSTLPPCVISPSITRTSPSSQFAKEIRYIVVIKLPNKCYGVIIQMREVVDGLELICLNNALGLKMKSQQFWQVRTINVQERVLAVTNIVFPSSMSITKIYMLGVYVCIVFSSQSVSDT